MADTRSDGPLLPLHKMSSSSSSHAPFRPGTPSSSPPPYSPSPSIDLHPSNSPTRYKSTHLTPTEEERYRNNRRKAVICIFLAVMILLVVPLAVFSIIVSKARVKDGCVRNDGGIMGDAICE